MSRPAAVLVGTLDRTRPRSAGAVALLTAALGAGSLEHVCPGCGATDHGAPRWSGADGHVSVSYGGGRVAVAHHPRRRVGIDIDVVAPPPPRLHRVLSAREVALVAASADPALAWTRLWCAKEAWTKALGVGLALPFASLCFAGLLTGAGDDRVRELDGVDGVVAMVALQ